MNSTNTSKQLATQEACNTEIDSWGTQRSESQCRANYQKKTQTKTSTQTKEQNQQKKPNKTQNQQNRPIT